MAKNIIIQEGGVEKQLSVDKIKTNKVGGGTLLWVPEEDVSLKAKTITKNGTYKAKVKDNCYGYSEVTVKVAGGKGEDGTGDAADKDGNPAYRWPSSSDNTDATKPGENGSGIVGNKTIGDYEIPYFIGVDEHGRIVETRLPSLIEIVTNPSKMSYSDGETINLSGAVVKAMKGEGETWTNSAYPNGIIPLGELAIEPSEAGESGGGTITGGTYNTYSGATKILQWQGIGTSTKWCIWGATTGTGRIVLIRNPSTQTISISGFAGDNGSFGMVMNASDDAPNIPMSSAGSKWGISGGNGYGPCEYIDGNVVDDPDGGINNAYQYAFGDQSSSGNTEIISITWARPGDGAPLSTIFEIEITASGSGYSDNSGGSQSGGGGGF